MLTISDLRECISVHEQTITFDAEAAVRKAFTGRRQKFVFVFNQNLRRTNLQIAELLSLLRIHTYRSGDRTKRAIDGLEFSTFSETEDIFSSAIGGIRSDDDDQLTNLAEELNHQIETKILVEMYYGTASVYITESMELDLALICGESGYIHSCGYQVFLRNVEKATELEYTQAIEDAFLLKEQGKKFLLVPYCHEDFSVQDRQSTPFLEHGLDDIKINMAKAYVGPKKLHEFVNDIGDKFDSNLLVSPSNYKDSAKEFERRFPKEEMNTIWIINDSSVNSKERFPGERKFYISYLQEFKGANYYHFYDENKPAWASHTTLPHSLAGSLINIARPYFPKNRAARIADPFCGSGTTLLEAQKFENIICALSDRAEIFDFIVRDNVDFFQLDREGLSKLLDDLQQFIGVAPEAPSPILKTKKAKIKEMPSHKLHNIRTIVEQIAAKYDNDFLKVSRTDVAAYLSDKSILIDRILFYLSMRVSVRGFTDIIRQTMTWQSFFQSELEKLLAQIKNHINNVSDSSTRVSSTSRIVKSGGSYSPAVYPDRPNLTVDDLFSSIRFTVADIGMLRPGSFDAIITDPPYGFNTDEDYWELAKFVRIMIPRLIESLNPAGGQLLLAAPQASFSGRVVIPFVRSILLGREIIKWCAQNGRECVTMATVLPSDMSSVRPPYYWIAEKTLQRKILHFWIRQKPLEQ